MGVWMLASFRGTGEGKTRGNSLCEKFGFIGSFQGDSWEVCEEVAGSTEMRSELKIPDRVEGAIRRKCTGTGCRA